MSKLKAGVIGLGMGWNHLKGYIEHPDVEVVAVADRRADRRDRAKAEYGNQISRIYSEGIEMIQKEKLDIVSVAVPNNQHIELTLAGLESGANVLCEKPMAMNAAEAQKMYDTAKRLGLKLGIDFSYRFNPKSRAMKQLVEAGKLGEIYYARTTWLRRSGVPGLAAANFNTGSTGGMGSWFFDKKQSGGGPLIDLGVHRLDLALWLMGYPEPSCVLGSTYSKIAPGMCKAQGLDYTVEDLACAMIKFKNGATIELQAGWAGNIKEKELQQTRLMGTKGGLYQYNFNEGYGYDVDYYTCENNLFLDTKLHDPVPEAPNPFASFADSVRDNTPFLVKPEDGVTVMKLLDAIYQSAATGKPVVF